MYMYMYILGIIRSRTVLRGPAHQLAVRMCIIICVIMVRSPIRYSTQYSATRQFFSTTALYLLCEGFAL